MNRIALVLTVCLASLAACKKSDSSTAAPEQAVEEKAAWGDQVPNDATSMAFAEALVRTPISDLRVTDDGAVLTYRSMSFKADGSWSASGDVAIADEKMECTESGAWSMEPAEKDDSGRVSWNIDKTSCAGRDAGADQRALIDLADGAAEIRFR